MFKLQANLISEECHCDDNSDSHLHYVRLYDVYEDSDYVHLVMENLKDGSLTEKLMSSDDDDDQKSSWEDDMCDLNCYAYSPNRASEITDKNFLSENNFKDVMRQLLHSVKFMHEAGIVHRDLKLDNIMI